MYKPMERIQVSLLFVPVVVSGRAHVLHKLSMDLSCSDASQPCFLGWYTHVQLAGILVVV